MENQKMTIDSSRLFRIAEVCRALEDEVYICFDKDGNAAVTLVDSSHVGIISLTMPRDVFYAVPPEGQYPLDLDKLKGLEGLVSGQKITVEWGKEIEHKNEADKVISITKWTIITVPPRIKIEHCEAKPAAVPKIPHLTLESNCDISPQELLNICKVMEFFTDYVELEISQDYGLYVRAFHDKDKNKEDAVQAELICCTGAKRTVKGNIPRSMFPLDYLKNMLKVLIPTIAPVTVNLRLGNNYPFIIEGDLDDKIKLMMMLAPRVEVE